MADEIQIDILADGTIRWTTGKVGAANHSIAERFLAEAAALAGGKVVVQKQGKAHTHGHEHGHTHEHA